MDKEEKIAREILEKTCETDEIFEDYDMDLIDAGYMDSFSVLSAILEIENVMGIRLQPTDMRKEDLSSVNAFIAFLKKLEDERK